MKKTIPFIALALMGIMIVSLSSCLKDECTEERFFIEYRAVYAQEDEFRVDPEFTTSRALENTGKIYFYDNYILINELYEGVHIIDNSQPSNPRNIGFISIPGNVDVAIREGYMYADNYTDLLTIDIRDLENPTIVCRDENVFNNYHFDGTLGYLVRTEATERRVSVDCSDPNFGDIFFNRGGFILVAENANVIDVPAGFDLSQGESGTGGSLARFTLAHNFLYLINTQELIAYDLVNPSCPDRTESTYVSWGIETLFPYKNYLFIGANNGMYIYDATVPAQPQYVSQFNHANACDPVFVKDDIAYVTLRDGTVCQNFINQLDIIDVSDIQSPQLIKSYDMDNPHGLSVRDNILYLCEGSHGLKVFETDNLLSIDDNRIEHIKSVHAFDVISLSSDHLILIGQDGLYQYNTSNPSNLEEISFISVEK